MENLVSLCRHHHRLVHEEGYRVECGGDGDGFVFRRPDGRQLRAVPRPRRGDVEHVCTEHRRRGLAIDAETSVPEWWGEPLVLDGAVQSLLAAAPVRQSVGV